MLEDGIEKVLLGITSLSELERVVELPLPNAPTVPTAPKADVPEDDFYSHIV
jgi:hypothetical protein